jgi:hypothetical protein
MIPSSRPSIVPPKAKKTIIEIPGSNNRIDLTESLSGDVTYENRTGSIEFIVLNDRPDNVHWYDIYNDIMNTIHGRRVKFSLEEEPDWYYQGRVEVNEWKTNKDYSRITLDYDVGPFKYKSVPTVDGPFRVSSTSTKSYTNSRMPTIPKFTATASGMTVSNGTSTYDLVRNQAVATGIVFAGNSTTSLTFTGNGNITVSYQEGKL